jgi:hypothetical protein
MIAITVDIDWSPDDVVEPMLEEFEQLGIPVTFMCTDPTTDRSGKSGDLTRKIGGRHELGLHPNFANRIDYEAVWDSALAVYPAATGFRPHNGMTGWPIVEGALRRGLAYEVLCIRSDVPARPDHLRWGSAPRFPVLTTEFWDSEYAQGAEHEWDHRVLTDPARMNSASTIFIAGFHPQNLYYDIRSKSEYLSRKADYHRPDPDAFVPMDRAKGPKRVIRDLARSYSRETFTTISGFLKTAGGEK